MEERTGAGRDTGATGGVSLNARRMGVALVISSALLWSLSGFFTQVPQLEVWQADVRGIGLALWRAVFALCLLLPLVRRISWDWKMIPMTLSFATMNLTFLTAMVVGSPANTIWLQYLVPVWVMLGAVFVFRERTTFRDWRMLAFCITGVLFILVMESVSGTANPTHRWWAPLLAVLSGISYAGVVLSIRSLKECDPAWLASLNHIVTAALVAPIYLWLGISIPTGSLWIILIALGTLQMGLPYYLFAKGLKSTPSHIASLLTLIEPVVLPVWVHLVRSADPTYSPPSWWTWVGGGLILVGLISRYLPSKPVLSRAFQPENGEVSS